MPNESVAVNLLLLCNSVVADSVSTSEGELTASWLSGLPLHGILRSDGSEVIVVVDDGALSSVDWVADGQGSTNKGAALGNDGTVKSNCSLLDFLDTTQVSKFGSCCFDLRRYTHVGEADPTEARAKVAAAVVEKRIVM